MTTTRNPSLQNFLDAAETAYREHVTDPREKTSVTDVFSALATVFPNTRTAEAKRLPVCRYLADLTEPSRFRHPALRQMIEAFNTLEPELEWRLRDGDWTGASANFAESHANALIVGPGGLERRSDVWIGVSLLAPGVRYPDHNHPPEETYLVMNGGDFRNDETEWLAVDQGGTFYNPPGIFHTMRSNTQPLFAFWALIADTTAHPRGTG